MSKTKGDVAQRLRDKRLADLFRQNQDFRLFVWTILQTARIFHPTYTQGSPHGTSYHEGRRSLGLEIVHMLTRLEPNALAILATEGLSLTVGNPTPEATDATEPPYPVSPSDLDDLP